MTSSKVEIVQHYQLGNPVKFEFFVDGLTASGSVLSLTTSPNSLVTWDDASSMAPNTGTSILSFISTPRKAVIRFQEFDRELVRKLTEGLKDEGIHKPEVVAAKLAREVESLFVTSVGDGDLTITLDNGNGDIEPITIYATYS